MSDDLIGRIALVTGSSGGIGRALAEELAGRGAAIVAHGLDREATQSLASEWQGNGWRSLASSVDLGEPDGARQLYADVRDGLGTPDILILNASVERLEPLTELSREAVDRQLAVNLAANCFLLQAALPAMAQRGWGRVVAIGSVQEERPNPHHLVYSATKAALTSVVLNLARNERLAGVTFNVVRPGAIETDRNRDRLGDVAFRRSVVGRIPTGRIGRPGDCAALISLLCSNGGDYINGAVIAVDGGLRL